MDIDNPKTGNSPLMKEAKGSWHTFVPSNRCQLADHHIVGYKTAMKKSAARRALTEMW